MEFPHNHVLEATIAQEFKAVHLLCSSEQCSSTNYNTRPSVGTTQLSYEAHTGANVICPMIPHMLNNMLILHKTVALEDKQICVHKYSYNIQYKAACSFPILHCVESQVN